LATEFNNSSRFITNITLIITKKIHLKLNM